MSKYLACPYLYEDIQDLKCDFELLTDEAASIIGLLNSFVNDQQLKLELTKVNTLVYSIMTSIRNKTSLTNQDLTWLESRLNFYKTEVGERKSKFVIPQGSTLASYCHILRTKFKALVRLLFKYKEQGNDVDEILFDFLNLLAGYFFTLALKLNKDDGIDEVEYIINKWLKINNSFRYD